MTAPATTRSAGSRSDVEIWQDWTDEGLPFLAADRPWERADVIVVNDDRMTRDPAVQLAITDWASSPTPT